MRLFRHPVGINGGFAVVDVETTGLYPSTDRVVEIAVIQLNADAQITAEFCTLINPRRDVGPTRIHGITAADITSAPSFASAAATLWQLLSGRILVAHNAPFDARFLNAEFTRCRTRLPPPPLMCTMQLASHYLRGLPARTLTACCDTAGIKLDQHHSALHDARAAAQLLARFRTQHRQLPESWIQALTQAALTAWIPNPPHAAQFHAIGREDQAHRRASQRPPLADLADRLPRGTGGDIDSYLAILDRILEDRIVSDAELTQLAGLAAQLGITQDTARRAHRDYLTHLSTAAWHDRQVTDAERADLLDVARLLDVPASEALTILEDTRHAPPDAQQAGALHPGDRVVFTGDMTLSRTEIEARATAAGLRVTSSISTKTALVVAADPHTQSGKANRARQLGIRMVTEQVFLYMLDQLQDTLNATISQSQASTP